MFVLSKGKTVFKLMPVTPSTAIAEGALVTYSSGKLIAATSSTVANLIEGRLTKAIAATDSDYATDRLVTVEVPIEKNVRWIADTASAVAADQGNDVDLTDSVTVNRGASSTKVVHVCKFISATKLMVSLNNSR